MSDENENSETIEKATEEESINIKPEHESFNQDLNFDYESKKDYFNDLFFRNSKLLKTGTKAHEDFWTFLKKYESLKRRKGQKTKSDDQKERILSQNYKLPLNYDKRWRFNFVYKANKSYISAYDSQGKKLKTNVTEDRLIEFEFIIHLYLDFCQKEKFKKLQQLRKAQSNLPVFKYKDEIINTIQNNQVTIIAGDTGCGKSTQIPRYLLESNCDRIACTQPRRIACMSLAKRVSYETLNEFRSEVAYQVRFEKTRTKHTKILFLTEGVLLRQIQTDANLSQYDYIVVDEVHERHVFTDFLLGILKCLIRKRQNLKIILMSATINIDLFSNYFDNCVIVKIPGRTYKIDVEYMPIIMEKDPLSKSSKIDPRPYIRLMQTIDKKYSTEERGDMLVFLSGMSDIQRIYEAAREYASETKRWIILQLHSCLSIEDQDKVFDIAPEGIRKCILSTNIAETSVTIDGLRFIVDSGKVKEISYDAKYKMQRLQEFWISRASAEQRKGRAGRTGPGVCYRLYSDQDYNEFNEFTTPEIRRVPLNSLILQMISMGLKDVRQFPFIEPPSIDSIEHSLLFLIDQNALNEKEELTSIGKMLADLPVDVQIGKMLIMGSMFNVVEPVVTMAASLSVQSPFLSNLRCDYETMQSRKEIISDHGDPMTLLNAFNEWIQVKTSHQNSRNWCKRRGLEEQRFYEISKLKKQFYEILKQNNLLKNRSEDDSSDSEIEDNDNDEPEFIRKARNVNRNRKRNYEKLFAEKERKRLLQLKKQFSKAPKKPKLLKLEEFHVDAANSVEIEDDTKNDTDIRDIEFKLMHNLNELQNKSLRSQRFRLKEVNLFKIILTCGLYPQIAISDEFNNYRRDSDQIFHSKYKSGVVLHPTSIFAYDPDVLQPPKDVKLVDKLSYSNQHQLLVYVNLFETNKSYLLNCMRVPALQTVLLYAKSLDTNIDFTRIVCDGWIEIRFLDCVQAQNLISSVLYLRSSIEKLFKLKLEFYKINNNIDNDNERNLYDAEDNENRLIKSGALNDSDDDDNNRPQSSKSRHYNDNNSKEHLTNEEKEIKISKLAKLLKEKLVEFLECDVLYSLRRMLPAEVSLVYIKRYNTSGDSINQGIESDIEFLKSFENVKQDETKGGFKITDYLTYNCLVSDATSTISSEYSSGWMQRHWICPKCSREFLFNLQERMKHEVECDVEADDREEKSKSKSDKISSNQKEYFCEICKKTIYLSPIEILKHRKSHSSN